MGGRRRVLCLTGVPDVEHLFLLLWLLDLLSFVSYCRFWSCYLSWFVPGTCLAGLNPNGGLDYCHSNCNLSLALHLI